MATGDAMPEGPATRPRSFAAPARKPGGRRRRLRIILGVVGGLVLLLAVLAALAPTLAGWFARGYVEDAINQAIPGSVRVAGLSLSWRGPQEAGPVTLLDPVGGQVATVTVRSDAGIWGLLMGRWDLGTLRVGGDANLVAGADGTTNLERALAVGRASKHKKPAAAPGAGSPGTMKLPAGIRGNIEFDKLVLSYSDPNLTLPGLKRGGTLVLPDITGKAEFEAGKPLTGSLSLEALSGASRKDANSPIGGLDATWTIGSLVDAQGVLTPSTATVEASAEFKDLSVAVADALLAHPGRLEAMLGPTLGAKVSVTGIGTDLRADITGAGTGVSADLGLRYTPSAIEASHAGTITIETRGLAVLAPGVFTATPAEGAGTMAVDQWPRAVLTLESLRVPLAGSSPDWAAASAKAELLAGEAAGRLMVGGGDEGSARVVAVRLQGLKAELATEGLGQGVHLTASNALEVDGRRAGDLSVDLMATNLVVPGPGGAPGAINPERVMLDGVATLSGLDTRIAQPFVQRLGVRLAQDVGPEADLELTAAARADPDSSLPETTVELRVNARSLTAVAEVALENGVAKTTGGGVVVEAANAGPLAMRLGQKAGLKIQGGMPVGVTVTDAHADLQRVLGGAPGKHVGPSHGPDLRGAGAKIQVRVGPTAGSVTLTPGGAARAFRLPESNVTVDTPNIAQGLNLRTRLEPEIDGAPAGTLDVIVAAMGMLDETGSLRAPPGPYRGRIAGQKVPAALVQALVPALAGARVDLPADVGPSIDFSLAATPSDANAASGTPTDFEFSVKGDKLAGGGSVVVSREAVKAGKSPLNATLQSPGPFAARWLPAGVTAAPGGTVSVKVTEFSLPTGESPDPLAATVRAEVSLKGLAITPPGEPPLQINSLVVSLQAPDKGPVKVVSDGSLKQGEQPFSLKGDVQLDGLIGMGADGRKMLTLSALRPNGVVTLDDAPVSLLAFVPESARSGEKVSDVQSLVALLRATAGPKVSTSLNMAPAQGGAGTDARVTVGSAGAHLILAAGVTGKQVALRESSGDFLLTPASVSALFDRFAPDQQPRPLPKSPARMNFTLSGAVLPRGADGMPGLAGAAPLVWTATVPGRLEIDNAGQIAGVGASDGLKGFSGLKMSGTVPLGALAAGGGEGDLAATVSALVIGGPEGANQKLDGQFAAHLNGGVPQGPMSARLRVTGLDTRWADAVAGQPGIASGLLGPAADVDLTFDARFAPASAAAGSAELQDGSVTVGVASPSFSMSTPATVMIRADRFELSKPTVVQAKVPAEWANTFAMGQAPATDGPPEPSSASFTAPTDVTLNLSALVIARGGGPMKPGVFSARATVDAPKVSMILGDGPAQFVGVHADVSGGQKPGVLGFSMRMAEAGTPAEKADPGAPPASGSVRFAGGLYGVCDDAGRQTFDGARITATGKAPGFNTAVLDALAGQDGLLLELLGPHVSLDVDLGGFSRETGKIGVKAVSTRANAMLKGTVQHGVLVASEPATAELNEVTRELGARLSKGLPLIGVFEKRPEDGPATLKATGLRVPFNHDLTQFDADFLFDFGTARFQASGAFASILKVVGANSAGEVGRKLAPLNIMVRSGVFSYDRYTLPLGEFTVQTQGKVDLVNQRIDFITYIPLGALTDEASGLFSTGLGSLLGGSIPMLEQATMVPWRTRGPMDNPTTTPEVGLFLKNAGQSLLTPGADLIQGIRDLFGGGGK